MIEQYRKIIPEFDSKKVNQKINQVVKGYDMQNL